MRTPWAEQEKTCRNEGTCRELRAIHAGRKSFMQDVLSRDTAEYNCQLLVQVSDTVCFGHCWLCSVFWQRKTDSERDQCVNRNCFHIQSSFYERSSRAIVRIWNGEWDKSHSGRVDESGAGDQVQESIVEDPTDVENIEVSRVDVDSSNTIEDVGEDDCDDICSAVVLFERAASTMFNKLEKTCHKCNLLDVSNTLHKAKRRVTAKREKRSRPSKQQQLLLPELWTSGKYSTVK